MTIKEFRYILILTASQRDLLLDVMSKTNFLTEIACIETILTNELETLNNVLNREEEI